MAAHDLAAECLSDGLMAKANAQKRRSGLGGGGGQGQADPRLIRVTRAGRKDDPGRIHRHCCLYIQRIIATHRDFCAQIAKIMHQIIGETVVVIDEKQHLAYLFRLGAGGPHLGRGILVQACAGASRGVTENAGAKGRLVRCGQDAGTSPRQVGKARHEVAGKERAGRWQKVSFAAVSWAGRCR